MNDGQIDYSSFTRRELVEALDGINREKYPRNYENLRKALARPEFTHDRDTRPRETVSIVVPDVPVYAGFWRRFAALWIDFLILSPLVFLAVWGINHYRLFNAFYFLPHLLIGLLYNVYLVRRFEGTPGKRFMGVRIKKLDGTRIGYREVTLRYSVDFLLGAGSSFALIVTALSLTDTQYFAATSFTAKAQLLKELEPTWGKLLTVATNVWIWSEFIVMMTNEKRRALHDFLAGTVVLCDDAQPGAPADASASRPRG
jgi:uncharacterized RDD family membrane protein YckC